EKLLKTSGLAEADATRLIVSLGVMRRHESTYMMRGASSVRTAFLAELDAFNKAVQALPADAPKAKLQEAIGKYADGFRPWVAEQGKADSNLMLIDSDTQEMMPLADRVNNSAKQREADATAAVAASQARTKAILFTIGCVAVFIGLVFSFWIVRSISRPLNG